MTASKNSVKFMGQKLFQSFIQRKTSKPQIYRLRKRRYIINQKRCKKIKQMQLSNNSSVLSNYYIHICINNIEIRHNNKFEDIYFSFIHKDKFHFSSAISYKTSYINDDIILYFQHEDQIPDTLKIQRWESHMILIEHEIDITEIKGRNFTKKKLQTKQNQIISLTITLYASDQIKFLDFPISAIMQHYLKMHKFSIHDQTKGEDDQLSYFQILTKQQKYIVPVTNSEVIVQLPAQFQICYYKNKQFFGKSDWFSSKQFSNRALDIGLFNEKGSYVSKIRFYLQWGTNLLFKKLQSSILYQAHELCIYDIEIKFDNFSEFGGVKLKFVYGLKAFQIIGEFNHRIVQFQRIIFIILKSEDEEISIYCQKMNKIVAQAKFSTTQMISHKVVAIKKYFTDPVSHRPLGYVKFLCEKAKNLSLPASNTFWKQYNKKKHPSKLMLRVQQLSVESPSTKNLTAVIKTEKQQYQIDSIINFMSFQPQIPIHQPLLLTIQQKSSIYILIKEKQQQGTPIENDFLGIAAINYEELRLGSNPIKIQFYKNQELTLNANCIINKIVPYPFIKGNFQPEIPTSPHTKTLSISAQILKIQFEPYFYTFDYEQKNQVYCIFEVGKAKKVIVLEPSKQSKLNFEVASSSDILSFVFSQSDFIKAKMTFLVSSLGKEQEVYGWSILKIKLIEFIENQMQKFDSIQIKNEHGIFIGSVSLQMKKGSNNSSQLLSNREIKKIKNQMIKVNESIERMERNLSKNKSIFVDSIKTPTLQRRSQRKDKKQLPVRYVSRKRYSPQNIKLPKI